MHAGKDIKLRRAAVAACVLPMTIGAVISIGGAYLATGHDAPLYKWVNLLYAAAALMMLPSLTSWLTGMRLRRIESVEKLKQWRLVFISALLIATCLQVVLGLGFGIYLAIEYEKIFGPVKQVIANGGSYSGAIPNAYIRIGYLSAIIWVIFTVPLTAVGTSIFRRVTKFPADRSVFDA